MYQDPQDPEKFNSYMHYKIMDPVDPDPQFYFANAYSISKITKFFISFTS